MTDDETPPPLTRRQLLATASTAAAGLTGCMRGPGPRRAADPWDEFSDETSEGTRSVRGRARLLRGEYVAVSIEPSADAAPIILSYHASSALSLPFDVLTFTREEFDSYRADDDADPLSSLSTENLTTAMAEARLPEGDYVLVLDNTGVGEGRPLDDVTIQFEMTVEYR